MEPLDSVVLAELVARREIEDVLVMYCRAVDRQDIDLLVRVYHDDGIDERTTPLPAHEWATAFLRDRRARGTRSTHMLSNVSLVLEGDTARSESYVLAVQYDPVPADGGDAELLAYGGRYLDVWQRRDRWAITHRRVVHEWNTLSPMRQLPWLQSLLQGAAAPDDLAFRHLSPQR